MWESASVPTLGDHPQHILHQAELLEDWALASTKRPLNRIEPLE
jgi:hypothetical protein